MAPTGLPHEEARPLTTDHKMCHFKFCLMETRPSAFKWQKQCSLTLSEFVEH